MKKFTWIALILVICGLRYKPDQNTFLSSSPIPTENPRNIILMIGDGMGLTQISALVYNNNNSSVLEQFPVIGFQKTQSASDLVTDSAASATAIASGKKTGNNVISLDTEGKPCKTILEEAEERGLASGLVVTSSIVHATPAAFIAHQPSRNLYEDIASDFLKTEVDLFIGGGKQFFDRRSNDERNLVDELKGKNYEVYDYFNSDIFKVKPSGGKNFAFFTADNQPLPASQGRDYLPHASKMALDYLEKRSEKGFFAVIEGSQIDWACHANQGLSLLSEMADFEKTIREVLSFAKRNGETLVIVTADHETGGTAINEGSALKKLDIRFTTNGHTASMVPVFAYGPKSELFRGIYENTSIYHKMMEALRFE